MDNYAPMMDVPPQRRNYYNDTSNGADGLKYRLGAEDMIKKVVNKLKGALTDTRGKIISFDNDMRLMNDEGVFHAEFFMDGAIGKTTYLTKYNNEDGINRETIPLAIMWADQITLHRKDWNIKNKDMVLQVVIKCIHESMLRANDGFENNNISRSHNVNENIDISPQQQNGWFGFGRIGSRGNQNG